MVDDKEVLQSQFSSSCSSSISRRNCAIPPSKEAHSLEEGCLGEDDEVLILRDELQPDKLLKLQNCNESLRIMTLVQSSRVI